MFLGLEQCYRINPKTSKNYGVDSDKIDEMIKDANSM